MAKQHTPIVLLSYTADGLDFVSCLQNAFERYLKYVFCHLSQ